MEVNQVVTRVNSVIAEGFEISDQDLVPNARLKEDLGMDSLDAIDLLVYLEDELNVKVEPSRLAEVKTLEDVYGMVETIAKEAAGSSV